MATLYRGIYLLPLSRPNALAHFVLRENTATYWAWEKRPGWYVIGPFYNV